MAYSNPKYGYIQRGKDFDVMFADNENTELYWETYNEFGDDPSACAFPAWVEDWESFKFYCSDYLDPYNWYEFGGDPDSHLMLIAKNGQIFYSDHYTDLKDFMKAIRPYTANHFAAAIFNQVGFEYFWVNGWDGLQALQKATGWFDMDVYYDWI